MGRFGLQPADYYCILFAITIGVRRPRPPKTALAAKQQ